MDASITIDEQLRNGTIIHTVQATDPDVDDNLSFLFQAGSFNGAFFIDVGTGEITVKDQEQFNRIFHLQFELKVEVQDEDGLASHAVITIDIKRQENGAIVPLKGFSPDGDGINDFWVIRGIEAFPQNEVKVFNRWGNVVFETRDYDNNQVAWRGQSNARLAIRHTDVLDGTYYFIITVPTLAPITGYLVVKH
jgi:gliding motility-associated-like protein